MGNRAVIVSYDTTPKNCKKKVGVYVHWNGNKADVQHVLDVCRESGVRSVTSDPTYFWARFCQAFANYISDGKIEGTSIGIGLVSELDTSNGDNGVYYIDDNFQIVHHTNGNEF